MVINLEKKNGTLKFSQNIYYVSYISNYRIDDKYYKLFLIHKITIIFS